MRSPELRVLKRGEELLEYTPEIMAFLREPRLLIIAKANIQARVHRRVYLDYVGIKRFDASGNLVGEQRIVGLFTSTAYTRSARSIPYLRRKIAGVEARAGFDANSHSGKALANILETYPRDELFQAPRRLLYRIALGILHLADRPRVKLFVRRDRFDRFLSVLFYVPRERYDGQLREASALSWPRRFGGHVSAYYPSYSDAPLVRVHYIIGVPAAPARTDAAALERARGRRTWSDDFASGGARRAAGRGAAILAVWPRRLPARATATAMRRRRRAPTSPRSAGSDDAPIAIRAPPRRATPRSFRLKL